MSGFWNYMTLLTIRDRIILSKKFQMDILDAYFMYMC